MTGDDETGIGDLDAQGATRAAWTHVAEGFERALKIHGLCAEDRACLLRQLRSADALSQRAPLALAPVTAAPEGVEYQTVSGKEWDGRAELDVGVMIRRYLAEHPPPADAEFSKVFAGYSEDLECSGRARLESLGSRPLRSVGGVS